MKRQAGSHPEYTRFHARYLAKREEILAQHKIYRQRSKSTRRAWYRANRSHVLEREKKLRNSRMIKIKSLSQDHPKRIEFALRRREGKRKYRQAHREQVATYQKKWWAEHADQKPKYRRSYYVRHSENLKRYQKSYNSKNSEKVSARKRKYYFSNSAAIKEKSRLYRLCNPERVKLLNKINSGKRRARLNGCAGSHTFSDWMAKVLYYGWHCYYCGMLLNEKTLEKDHAIPISRGGSDFLSNLIPSCRPCNRRKSKIKIFDFLREM